ncbi:hypothetical protein E2C01_054471 [Portunus trituberculatus]|uniref:Uncharacterized protein n=1 Tax=Portunus trituberculatus TaxID=210409 RepID=A0A5B7GTS4_PORTR|nr:hypothetical protein [Portunus trituberculatus]
MGIAGAFAAAAARVVPPEGVVAAAARAGHPAAVRSVDGAGPMVPLGGTVVASLADPGALSIEGEVERIVLQHHPVPPLAGLTKQHSVPYLGEAAEERRGGLIPRRLGVILLLLMVLLFLDGRGQGEWGAVQVREGGGAWRG